MTRTTRCGWCDDTTPDHRHYTVLCYEGSTCLGRLGSDGTAVSRKIFALILSRERAEQIAAEINADTENDFTARAKPF